MTHVRRHDHVIHVAESLRVADTRESRTPEEVKHLIWMTNKTVTVTALCGRRFKMHHGNTTRITDQPPTCILCVAEDIHAETERQRCS